jgi:putative membrane protein
MKSWKTLVAALVLVPSLALVTLAEEPKDRTRELPSEDQFLTKALVNNNAVIRMAELVESRSENADVEAFAKEVIEAHKKTSDELGKMVKDRKVAVVAGLEKDLRDKVEELSKLKGKEFDRAYLDHFIRHHEQCVAMCKDQASTDKPLATFAKDCKTKLESHLKRARELRDSLSR